MRPNALGDREQQETTMLKSHMTAPRIVATLAAGFILIAATEGALARVNTGTRPISPSKGFGINTGVGKGVGADGGVAMGGGSGSSGVAPKAPRQHRNFPPQK
jgi:hypothetical protein